jgi:hypothetical protein
MQKLKVINNKAHHFSEGKAEDAGMCVECGTWLLGVTQRGPLNGWRAIPTAMRRAVVGCCGHGFAICINPEVAGMFGYDRILMNALNFPDPDRDLPRASDEFSSFAWHEVIHRVSGLTVFRCSSPLTEGSDVHHVCALWPPDSLAPLRFASDHTCFIALLVAKLPIPPSPPP